MSLLKVVELVPIVIFARKVLSAQEDVAAGDGTSQAVKEWQRELGRVRRKIISLSLVTTVFVGNLAYCAVKLWKTHVCPEYVWNITGCVEVSKLLHQAEKL